MQRLKRAILSWNQCVPLSEYSDIPDVVDVDSLTPLGEGQYGTVFSAKLLNDAYGLSSGTKVALKEMNLAKLLEGRVDVDDLKTEILAMRKLSKVCSDHVAQYYDVIYVPDADLLYIVMELIRGKDLNRHTSWGRKDQYLTHERIARGLATGLQCLHQNRIAHRDIKPENAMANEPLTVLKWVDLGFSCVTYCKLDQPAESVGTALFWAPEVLSGQMDGSLFSWQAADVYSFGLVLHEMCGGRIDLATERGGAKLTNGPVGSQSEYVNRLMHICLTVDPEERYDQWELFMEESS